MHFLIVGAGSAGSVVSRRLLDSGHTVSLVEAGGSDDANPNIAHLNTLGLIWHSEQDWDYYTVPQPGANQRSLHVPRGKVTGGSHSLNACIWVRGASSDYDTWERMGCSGWGWQQVLPYFMKAENYDGAPNPLRGRDGLLDVVQDYPRQELQESMLEATLEQGHPLNEDYNLGEPTGVSRMQLTLRNGLRFSSWSAYLKPVLDHENLTVHTGLRVAHLLLKDRRVQGIVVVDDTGKEQELRADAVILCAGALGSPEILLRSGIGPRAELQELGITVQVDSPKVGKNLQDHFLSPVIYSSELELGHPQTAPTQTHFFAKSQPELAHPDTQPLFFSYPMYSQGYPGGMSGPEEGFTLMAGIVSPHSRGELKLTGTSLADPVHLDLGTLAEQADVDALVESVRQCRAIGRQPVLAQQWQAQEIWPGEAVTDDDLEQYVRDSVVTYHHQVGTCSMGPESQDVVDPQTLGVRGVEGLHIMDASIMPKIPTGNTNAPSIMIGEKGADIVLELYAKH